MSFRATDSRSMCAQESSFGKLFGISWEWHKKCSHTSNWKCVCSSNCSVELIKLYTEKKVQKNFIVDRAWKIYEKRNYWLDWNTCNSVGEYFCRCDFYIFFILFDRLARSLISLTAWREIDFMASVTGMEFLRWVLLIHIDISYIYFVSMYKKMVCTTCTLVAACRDDSRSLS